MTVFARVQETTRMFPGTQIEYIEYSVVEYPVLLEHIVNRGHPVAWYREVVCGIRPSYDEFQYVAHKAEYNPLTERVELLYTVNDKPLHQVLTELYTTATEGQPLYVHQVSLTAVERVSKMIEDYAVTRLNLWAKEKDYDNIVSLVNYKDDPDFGADAAIGAEYRRLTWRQLYAYRDQILAQTLPIPAAISDIEAQLPVLVWPQ